jgi:hypothetical protein
MAQQNQKPEIPKLLGPVVKQLMTSYLGAIMSYQPNAAEAWRNIHLMSPEQIVAALGPIAAKPGTLEHSFARYLSKGKHTIDTALGAETSSVGLGLASMGETFIGNYVEQVFGKVKLDRTTEFSLIAKSDKFSKTNEFWVADEKAMKQYPEVAPPNMINIISEDLGVTVPDEIYLEIYRQQCETISQFRQQHPVEERDLASYANLVLGNKVRRADLNYDGKSAQLSNDNVGLTYDIGVSAGFVKEYRDNAAIAMDEKGEIQLRPLAREKDETQEAYQARCDEHWKMRDDQYEYGRASNHSCVSRMINGDGKNFPMKAADKASLVEKVNLLCSVLGITVDALMTNMEKRAREEKIPFNRNDKGPIWTEIQAAIESTTKELKADRKEYIKHLGKPGTIPFDERIPVGSRFLSQAIRDCICDNAREMTIPPGQPGHNRIRYNRDLADTLEGEKRTLQLALGIGGDYPIGKDEGKIQAFIKDVFELGERAIPDQLFSLMRSNINLQNNTGNNADLAFNMLTQGSFDSEILKLEKQLHEKYKDQGIDIFAIQVQIEGGKDGVTQGKVTLAEQIKQMYGRSAMRHAKAITDDIAERSSRKKGTKESDNLRQNANALFDVDKVKEGTGSEIEKDKKSGEYHKPVTKPPYRALALAMDMINQVARQMCSSFQKTTGAGGFYEAMTQEKFNKMVGYGQKYAERATDLKNFFFGSPDCQNQKSTVFGHMSADNPNFVEFCKDLKIEADKAVFEEFIKQPRNIEKVETTMMYIQGLSIEYDSWREKYGVEAREMKEAEASERQAAAQSDLVENAVHELRQRGDKQASQLISKLSAARAGDNMELVAKLEAQIIEEAGLGTTMAERAELAQQYNVVEMVRLEHEKGIVNDNYHGRITDDIKYLEAMNIGLEVVKGEDPEELEQYLHGEGFKRGEYGKYLMEFGMAQAGLEMEITRIQEKDEFTEEETQFLISMEDENARKAEITKRAKGPTPKYDVGPPGRKSRTRNYYNTDNRWRDDDDRMRRLQDVLVVGLDGPEIQVAAASKLASRIAGVDIVLTDAEVAGFKNVDWEKAKQKGVPAFLGLMDEKLKAILQDRQRTQSQGQSQSNTKAT